MWYFTYWVLNIIIKLFCMLAGRSAVDIWWWRFWGWGVLCMVSVDSPWWQWHLNGSRLSFLCFVVICTRRWRWLPFFYIYWISLFLLLVGATFLFGMWCISGSVCISAILGSTFKLWMDSVYYCRIDEIDFFILILVLINCIHLISCAGAMKWVSCGVVW